MVATFAVTSSWGMQDYSKLLVWRKARALTVSVHESCPAPSLNAAPGLRAQLMRATMSIAANIAEGARRDSRLDFARFVAIAAASAGEVEHHLLVVRDLTLIDLVLADRLRDRVVEVRRMLYGLRRAIVDSEMQERARKRSATTESDDSRHRMT